MDLFTTLVSNCTDTHYNGSSYVRGCAPPSHSVGRHDWFSSH